MLLSVHLVKMTKIKSAYFIHPTATVEPGAKIADGSKIWHYCHVRKGTSIGKEVSLGKDVFLDSNVSIGSHSRIQNGVSIYDGCEIQSWCFVGPNVTFTNDLYPRVGNKKWKKVRTIMETGMSIGAGSVLICGIRVGTFAVIGAGSIVTSDVPPFHVVIGSPARPHKMVCACGSQLFPLGTSPQRLVSPCCKRNLDPALLKIATNTTKNKNLFYSK